MRLVIVVDVGTVNRSLATVSIVSGTFATVLGSTILNVPLRDMSLDLHVPIAQATLLVTLPGITFASLLPLGGWAGNRYGRRTIFALACATIALTGGVAFFAPTFGLLVAMRIISGAASATIVPVVMTILSELYEADRRALALSAWATANSLAQALGPPLGGILATTISWRAAFVPPAVMAALACIAALRFVPHDPPKPVQLDWRAATGLTAGAALLLVAFTLLPQLGTGSPLLWAMVLGGCAGLYVFREAIAHSNHPFVAPRAFRERSYMQSSIGIFAATMAFGAALLATPLYLTFVLGLSTLAAGFVSLALPLAMAVAAPFSSRFIGRFGTAPAIAASLVALAVATVAVDALITQHAGLAVLIVFLAFIGAAIAVAYTATAAGATASEAGRFGAGIGLFNLVRIAGASAGAALVAIVLHADPAAYGAIFGYSAAVLALALIAGVPFNRGTRRLAREEAG